VKVGSKMNILEYAGALNVDLNIIYCYKTKKFILRLEYSGNIHGEGTSFKEAMLDYITRITGRVLEINSPHRGGKFNVTVPKLTYEEESE